jgi:uncharacterized membrane protein YecN with MAPEG domain
MFLPVTILSSAILAILLVILSLRVIGIRRKERVSLGDGGNELLSLRIRGQGNLAEYGPLGLFLLLLLELQGTPVYLTALAALVFLTGRLLHGYAFGFTDGNMKLRVLGMQLTISGIILLVVLNVLMLVFSGFMIGFM